MTALPEGIGVAQHPSSGQSPHPTPTEGWTWPPAAVLETPPLSATSRQSTPSTGACRFESGAAASRFMHDHAMATTHPDRPWYCADDLVEDYKTVGRKGGDLKMMKAAKWFRSMVVNFGIIAIALYALSIGGDTTIIAGIALTALAAYNGVEIADYQALAQAIVELSHESQDDTE